MISTVGLCHRYWLGTHLVSAYPHWRRLHLSAATSSADDRRQDVDLAVLGKGREKCGAVHRAINRYGDAAIEKRLQFRVRSAETIEQLADGGSLDFERRVSAELVNEWTT